MVGDTITVELLGDIPLGSFSDVIRHFKGFVDALCKDTESVPIDWTIDELRGGSALTEIRGAVQDGREDLLDEVIHKATIVARAAQRGDPLPFSEQVGKQFTAMTGVLNGRVQALRLETAEDDIVIESHGTRQRSPSLGAYGAIEGRIEALNRRKKLRFTLYDFTYDRAVNCYLERDQQEMLRDLWGRRVIVEGWVTRDPFSGRPTSIHRIRAIEPIEESEPGSYARARGILPYRSEDPSSEVAIRMIRDAW